MQLNLVRAGTSGALRATFQCKTDVPLFCRSELARENPKPSTLIRVSRVIVNDLREQARAYREKRQCQGGLFLRRPAVSILTTTDNPGRKRSLSA